MGIRSLSPEYIAFDEISESSAGQLMFALNSGVAAVATAHARTPGQLMKKNGIRELLENGVFESVAFFSAPGRLLQKSDNKAAQALGGAAQVAGAVGAVSTAADMLSESANNAEAMADAYGVPVPNIKKQLIAFSIVPVLVLIAIYIPQYAQGSQEAQEKIALAAEQIDMTENALKQVCERVSADDPYEKYKDYGYHARGYLREGDYSWEGAYVYLTFDEYGTITEINYCEGVDIAASLEENLSQAERDFQTLNAPLSGLNISVADPELLATSAIPVDFKETFLAGSFYEGVRVYSNDTPVRVACSFDTESEEEFDEYSRPQITLSVWKANS